MAYFDDPVQLVDYVYDKVDQNKGPLGIAYLGYGEELLIPEFPAALFLPGAVAREWHGTHTWNITLLIEIWVYHARLSDSHRVRTRDDMQLVASVRDLLHSDIRLRDVSGEPQCAGSWVNAEDPAFINRRSDVVIGSRLEFTCISQQRFK